MDLKKTNNNTIAQVSREELLDTLRKRSPEDFDEKTVNDFATILQCTAEIAPMFNCEVVLVEKSEFGPVRA